MGAPGQETPELIEKGVFCPGAPTEDIPEGVVIPASTMGVCIPLVSGAWNKINNIVLYTWTSLDKSRPIWTDFDRLGLEDVPEVMAGFPIKMEKIFIAERKIFQRFFALRYN